MALIFKQFELPVSNAVRAATAVLDQGLIDRAHENWGSSCANSLLPMKPSRLLGMPCRNYIQKLFTLSEIVIVFAVIAFLLAATLPQFLRARKRSQASKIVIFARSSSPLASV